MYAIIRVEMSSIEPEKVPGIPGGPGGPGGPGILDCRLLPACNKCIFVNNLFRVLTACDLVTSLQNNSYSDSQRCTGASQKKRRRSPSGLEDQEDLEDQEGLM